MGIQLDHFFSGLKVVELASVLAGPSVGMFFAEMGAQVIKIENKTTDGDVTRRWKVPGEPAETTFSAYYQQVNFGKKVLLLNLKENEDQEIALEHIREADIVISNFLPEKARKMRMDATFLRSLNPKLIFAHLSAFGLKSTRPAFDVVLQAEAGFLFMTGYPDGPPAKMPIALIDLLAAHQLKEGILVALIHRMRTGQGSIVRTSLIESAIASLANQASNWLVAGHIPQRMGTQHPNIAPYGDLFYTKDDKLLVLAAGTERHFERLCKVLQVEKLPKEELYRTNANRVQNRIALNKVLGHQIEKWDRAELLSHLEAAGVPAGAIRKMDEVFELPQAQAMIRKYILPDGSQGTSLPNGAFQLEG
ncbi:MAG: CoA transferase [Bacteroidota bacterium]